MNLEKKTYEKKEKTIIVIIKGTGDRERER